MTDVVLRSAAPGDLDAVVAVFLACFRVTYATRLPPRVGVAIDHAEASTLWSQVLTTPGRQVVVAVTSGSPRSRGVCGVVGFGADGPTGWIHSLYVAPDRQGSGTGSALLRYATGRLAEAACRTGRLWVFADNAPSIAFYASHGWSPDGSTRVEERFGENEIRLSRSLAAP